MKHSITTCLSFTNNAEEAIRFYIDIFNQAFNGEKGVSKILKETYFGEEELSELLNVPDVPKRYDTGPGRISKNHPISTEWARIYCRKWGWLFR